MDGHIAQLGQKETEAYWKRPGPENNPGSYFLGEPKSRYLVSLFKRFKIPLKATILELGGNVGRNLYYLSRSGYIDLTEVDINQDALTLSAQVYGEDSWTRIHGTLRTCLPTLSKYHTVFSMAVLEHIHPNYDVVFQLIADRVETNLITIEDEVGTSPRHFPRCYQPIFEATGLQQLLTEPVKVKGLEGFTARVFKQG